MAPGRNAGGSAGLSDFFYRLYNTTTPRGEVQRGKTHGYRGLSSRAAWAWMAVMATVLTMSATVQPRLRSFTG